MGGTPLHCDWFDKDHLPMRRCHHRLHAALTCEGSLTEYLSQYCPDGLSLQVLAEQWQQPLAEDILGLENRAGDSLLVREINLTCGNIPFVYGRSLFPRTTYHHCRRSLVTLGQRPLGAWLFRDRRIYRQSTQIGRIKRHSRLYRLALSGLRQRPAMLWGRRSVFIINGQPLLVLEIFLPALISCIHTSKKP